MAAKAWDGETWGPGVVVPLGPRLAGDCLSSASCGFSLSACLLEVAPAQCYLTGLCLQPWGSHWDGADR